MENVLMWYRDWVTPAQRSWWRATRVQPTYSVTTPTLQATGLTPEAVTALIKQDREISAALTPVLSPYTGGDGVCAKCAATGPSTRYVERQGQHRISGGNASFAPATPADTRGRKHHTPPPRRSGSRLPPRQAPTRGNAFLKFGSPTRRPFVSMSAQPSGVVGPVRSHSDYVSTPGRVVRALP